MIGAKSIASLAVVGITLVGTLWHGSLSFEHLGNLSVTAAFAIGAFAAVVGTLAYRYWGLQKRSATYFRIALREREGETQLIRVGPIGIEVGQNNGLARDLPASVQHIAWVGFALMVAMASVDGRTLQHLSSLPARAAVFGSEYCTDPSEKKTKTAEEKPGCELVRRAFEMGFADSLGECGETEEEVEAYEICTRRQYDEPMAHYTWRLLKSFAAALSRESSPENLLNMARHFTGRAEHLNTYFDAQRFALDTRARASHHIFTNLPSPHSAIEAMAGGALARVQCLDRYTMLPHRPHAPSGSELRSSLETEHVIGQLLFDTRYEAAAAFCREYTIHWGAPIDSCEQLSMRPQEFLEDQGAWAQVREVLDRYELNIEATNLEAEESGDEEKIADAELLRWVLPGRFISFRCYFEELRVDEWRSNFNVAIDGHHFKAYELRINKPDEDAVFVERYGQLAPLLATGFHYDAIVSSAAFGTTYVAGDSPRAFLKGRDGFMSKLDYFNEIDIFLGNGWWVPHRNDLMEIYPYHVHMQNFIDMFRTQYRVEQDRL